MHSMISIGIIPSFVCLSVRPSVTLCIVEGCSILFPGRHFLFTSSICCTMYHLATIDVGFIVQTQQPNRRNFRVWNSQGQHGYVTMVFRSRSTFSLVRFCSSIELYRTLYAVRSAFLATAMLLVFFRKQDGAVGSGVWGCSEAGESWSSNPGYPGAINGTSKL